jgi:serine/threonine protein kinase
MERASTKQYQKGDEPVPGYRLVEFLGRGGFGEVWKARGPGNILVALKIMNLAANKLALREFRVLGEVKDIHHAHLVTIFGIWVKDKNGAVCSFEESQDPDSAWLQAHGGELIIGMELGEGSLADRLRQYKDEKQTGIPIHDLLGYMTDAADGLDYLNQSATAPHAKHRHIQHCDIKPHNLLLIGGTVKVCDYGLARPAGVRANAESAGLATILYCPPEIVVDSTATETSDQYSLAVSYYELRTGSLPYDPAAGLFELLDVIATGRLVFSQISDAEKTVLQRATSRQPKDRYRSNREMVADLRHAIEGPPPKPSGSVDEFFICPPHPGPGDQVVPDYYLVERLGSGGVGEVWRAEGPGKVPTAIKIISNLDGLGGRELEALELMRNVRHVHLLDVHGYWLIDANGQMITAARRTQPDPPKAKRLIIATELADINLREYLEECRQQHGDGGLPTKELLRYMRQVAMALDYMNSFSAEAMLATAANRRSSMRSKVLSASTDGAKSAPPPRHSDAYATLSSADWDTANKGATDTADTLGVSSKDWSVPLKQVKDSKQLTAKRTAEQGIQHRDIKPENILMVGSDVKIADFSLAKVLSGAMGVLGAKSSAVTMAYAAPELFHGQVSRWTDQYSLAVTYYHLRTGRLPFKSEAVDQVRRSHIEGRLDLSGLGTREREIIEKATAINPEDRYGTCLAMVDDLEKALFPPGRQLWRAALAGAVILILAAVLGYTLLKKPAVAKTPMPGEPTADATTVTINGQDYPSRIVVDCKGTQVPFCRVAPTPGNDNDPALFYIMENKVANDLFEKAINDPDFLERLDHFQKEMPWAISKSWKKGRPADVPSERWAHLPTFDVTVAEAYCFAAWFGDQLTPPIPDHWRGNIPSVREWDKAGGYYDGDKEMPIPNLKLASIEAPEKEFAVKRGEPVRIDETGRYVSRFGCRQLADNGAEWTRELHGRGEVPDKADQNTTVELRGASFRDSDPFRFRPYRKEQSEPYSSSEPDIGFRVVLEQKQ